MAEVDETRAIVGEGETYEGSLIPTRRREIDRDVVVHEGGTVTGGVYGGSVTVEAGATVQGPVMAKGTVDVDDGEVTGDVGTPGKVVGDGGTVRGTVTGTRVRLSGCSVEGNVAAEKAILDDCTVVGVVAGANRLELRDVVCYTFESRTAATVSGTKVVLGQAVVDGRVDLETPVPVLSVRPSGDAEAANDEDARYALTDDDVYEHEGTRYLTITPRLLDLEAVRDRLDRVEDAMRRAVTSPEASVPDYEEWFRDEGTSPPEETPADE